MVLQFRNQKVLHQTGKELQRLAGGADKVTQDGHVGTVGADAAGINWEAEAFSKIEIHTGIVEFGKAETRSGQHAVKSGRIDGARRPMALPGAARQFIKLLPIAFVPRVHLTVYLATSIGCGPLL